LSFFEPPDLRVLESADPSPATATLLAVRRHAIALAVCVTVTAAAYAANVAIGFVGAAATSGTLAVAGLWDRVTIVRDARDIPHIAARNDHDLFFAQGYVVGSDRLFQLDLTRRYAYGRLSELFGAKTLPMDESQRAVDIAGIARRQFRALDSSDRAAITSFADGVNEAAASQPLPVEFRILLYRPAPWTPQDSLAVSIVASLELSESWHEVFARDAIWRLHDARCFDAIFPLSDDRYDVTIDGARTGIQRRPRRECGNAQIAGFSKRSSIGSNAWAAGATRTLDGRALIANDPHLDVTIPGIWYLIDIEAPGFHVAGATIPGIPGVLLGHNERLAWASTNANVATTTVFHAGDRRHMHATVERFRVRFARDVEMAYYRTKLDFLVPDDNDRSATALIRWPIYAQRRSTIATVLALDRARSLGDALRVLAEYHGSPQNFILADRSGSVAYHVAGIVPDDPAWGRYVHAARDARRTFAPIPFELLPARAAARDVVLVSANNKAYGPAYPYRLSAQFELPYRAYRISELLQARPRYDAAYFARMQLDTFSPFDREIARAVARFAQAYPHDDGSAQVSHLLASWNGRYDPDSRAASLEHAVRVALFERAPDPSAGPNAWELRAALPYALYERRAWRVAGGMRIEHPLAPMNFAFLNGAWLPGEGDEYTIHLQEPGFAQGFRAVWDVGDWDRGGIVIPSGESGEPGSGHYTDLTRAWIEGTLQPLPFGSAAVRQNAVESLVLRPSPP
jgi:penicillin G amidase